MSPSQIPPHPVVGTVVAVHRVTRVFGAASRRRSYGVGHRYDVRRPDGVVVSMTSSEFDKAVYRATPKDHNLAFPWAKVGVYVSGIVASGILQGYRWHGEIARVTRKAVFIRPEPIPDKVLEPEVEMFDVHQARREIEMYRAEYQAAISTYRQQKHELAKEFGLRDAYGDSPRHAEMRNSPHARAIHEALWAADAELRKKYPSITDREAAMAQI